MKRVIVVFALFNFLLFWASVVDAQQQDRVVTVIYTTSSPGWNKALGTFKRCVTQDTKNLALAQRISDDNEIQNLTGTVSSFLGRLTAPLFISISKPQSYMVRPDERFVWVDEIQAGTASFFLDRNGRVLMVLLEKRDGGGMDVYVPGERTRDLEYINNTKTAMSLGLLNTAVDACFTTQVYYSQIR